MRTLSQPLSDYERMSIISEQQDRQARQWSCSSVPNEGGMFTIPPQITTGFWAGITGVGKNDGNDTVKGPDNRTQYEWVALARHQFKDDKGNTIFAWHPLDGKTNIPHGDAPYPVVAKSYTSKNGVIFCPAVEIGKNQGVAVGSVVWLMPGRQTDFPENEEFEDDTKRTAPSVNQEYLFTWGESSRAFIVTEDHVPCKVTYNTGAIENSFPRAVKGYFADDATKTELLFYAQTTPDEAQSQAMWERDHPGNPNGQHNGGVELPFGVVVADGNYNIGRGWAKWVPNAYEMPQEGTNPNTWHGQWQVVEMADSVIQDAVVYNIGSSTIAPGKTGKAQLWWPENQPDGPLVYSGYVVLLTNILENTLSNGQKVKIYFDRDDYAWYPLIAPSANEVKAIVLTADYIPTINTTITAYFKDDQTHTPSTFHAQRDTFGPGIGRVGVGASDDPVAITATEAFVVYNTGYWKYVLGSYVWTPVNQWEVVAGDFSTVTEGKVYSTNILSDESGNIKIWWRNADGSSPLVDSTWTVNAENRTGKSLNSGDKVVISWDRADGRWIIISTENDGLRPVELGHDFVPGLDTSMVIWFLDEPLPVAATGYPQQADYGPGIGRDGGYLLTRTHAWVRWVAGEYSDTGVWNTIGHWQVVSGDFSTVTEAKAYESIDIDTTGNVEIWWKNRDTGILYASGKIVPGYNDTGKKLATTTKLVIHWNRMEKRWIISSSENTDSRRCNGTLLGSLTSADATVNFMIDDTITGSDSGTVVAYNTMGFASVIGGTGKIEWNNTLSRWELYMVKTAPQEYVTSYRYDTTTHKFQKKVRTVRAWFDAAEGDWVSTYMVGTASGGEICEAIPIEQIVTDVVDNTTDLVQYTVGTGGTYTYVLEKGADNSNSIIDIEDCP